MHQMILKWFQHRTNLNQKLEERAATKIQAQARRRLARSDIQQARLEKANAVVKAEICICKTNSVLFPCILSSQKILIAQAFHFESCCNDSSRMETTCCFAFVSEEKNTRAREIERMRLRETHEREASYDEIAMPIQRTSYSV